MKQIIKTLLRILVMLVLYFVTQAVIMTIFAAIGGLGVEGDIQGAMENYLVEKAALISFVHNALIVVLLLLYRRRKPFAKEAMPFAKLPLKELGRCAAIGVCAAIVVTTLLSLLPIPESAMAEYSSTVTQSTTGTFLERLFAIVLLAPIAEEMLFRGAIYGSLKQSTRHIAAIGASCALFGIMHQNPIWMIYAFLMGLGLTLALDAYKSLLAPIVLHIAFNLVGASIPAIAGSIPAWVFVIASVGCIYLIAVSVRQAKAFSLNTAAGENREDN